MIDWLIALCLPSVQEKESYHWRWRAAKFKSVQSATTLPRVESVSFPYLPWNGISVYAV